MPTLTRRKIIEGPSRNASLAISKGSITAFGRISKPTVRSRRVKKAPAIETTKICLKDCSVPDTACSRGIKRKFESAAQTSPKDWAQSPSPASGRRKLDVDVKEESFPRIVSSTLPTAPTKTPPKNVAARSQHADTPSKGARAFLEAFALNSSPKSPRSPVSPSPQNSSLTSVQPCTSSGSVGEDQEVIPKEIETLIGLHSAFLTALSLHYAHHGSFAPADLRVLIPTIERAWGRRRTKVEDIRRILKVVEGDGIETGQNGVSCPISLSDYGSGRICVEISESTSPNTHRRCLLDVNKHSSQFSKNITHLWHQSHSQSPESFISALPLSPISTCPSLAKISPLLTKGQQQLADLKAGAIKAQQANSPSPAPLKPPQSTSDHPPPPQNRNSTLLTRILAKELHQSTLPAPPSPATLARKAALQRLPDVIPVLELLTRSSTRSVHTEATTDLSTADRTFSFTMPTVVQHLQMSLRNPISREEATRCMRLLAEEIAPGWVGIRNMGSMVGVTVRKGKALRREEVRRMVDGALEKSGA